MSKLSHSNDESMREIEMCNAKFLPIKINRPRCSAVVAKNSTRTIHGNCTRFGKWEAANGDVFCDMHAK
jgi:hypothetical protein